MRENGMPMRQQADQRLVIPADRPTQPARRIGWCGHLAPTIGWREHLARRCAPLRPAIGLVIIAMLAAPAVAGGKLKPYKSRYYIIHTDLAAERVAEVRLRIEKMAEAYHERTSGFGGRITKRLPFYMFSDQQGYLAAGGVRDTGGLFDGKRLMMIAGPEGHPGTWRLMQHEGFHQFVHAVIGGRFPAWGNEGMAEYFGDSEFTGDGYILGVIPPERLRRLQHWISEGHAISINEMMKMSQGSWNAKLSLVHYDQAWSMIYFLAHAQNGKYQRHLNRFIRDVSRGDQPMNAWHKNFGKGTRAFEKQWRDYWASMPANPTSDKYAEAAVAKVTSFYARSFAQRQVFKRFDEFVAAAKAGRLKQHEDDWLPPMLLNEALRTLDDHGEWEIRKLPGRYQVVCTRPDKMEYIGTFKVKNRQVHKGSVKVTKKRARR